MSDFMVRFLICNLFICGIIGILFTAKRILKNSLSSRMQYNLWFIFLGILTFPFLPFRLVGFPQILSWLSGLRCSVSSGAGTASGDLTNLVPSVNTDWMNDFSISVKIEPPSALGSVLSVIWLAGILAAIAVTINAFYRLRRIKKSSLPLQNREVSRLYQHCLEETGIRRDIPVYSTAFLKSPIIVGIIRPSIYLPIHLISDYNEAEMRYILLHELQHYKHHDSAANYLMILAGAVYWFNPLVRYALKEMRNDREIACDTSVLAMLDENLYEEYGNTLVNFAEKISLAPFPFAAGLGSSMDQMKRRIINIAAYEKPTLVKRLKGITAFTLISVLLLGCAPFVSTYVADRNYYQWDASTQTVSYMDLTAYFGEYEGSFVLYDSKNDAWSIHDRERAALRTAPDSTYKIYDALFGLEEGIITPDHSLITWNGEAWPFESWNADQTLTSAMSSSVNWYFREIDDRLGVSDVCSYIQKIRYGNEDLSAGFPAYWMESSLEISPIEQVELLLRLQNNSFGFNPGNINAVKEAIRLFSSDTGTFYGKTGTGRVNGQDVNGWFIGFIETEDNTYYFAANIAADSDAAGSNAAEIALAVLYGMNIWD